MVISNNFLDFVGVGISKSGTSWISRNLGEHPEIFIPEKKELHFFNNDYLYKKKEKYLKHYFPKVKKKYYGEITPRYSISQKALERIKHDFPKVKIIFILRDPVDRAFSQYKYFKYNLGKETAKSFTNAIDEGTFYEDYIIKSQYSTQILNIYNIFNKKQVLILYFEDISNKPLEVLKKLYIFLNLKDKTYIPKEINKKINKTISNKEKFYFIKIYNKIEIKIRNNVNSSKNLKRIKIFFVPFFKMLNYIFNFIPKQKISNRIDEKLSKNIKNEIYCKYFKKDIERVEKILNTNLTKWKGGKI